MKKNLVVTLLTVAMTATLVACGATGTNEVEANSTEMTTEYGTENGIATLDETEEVESVEMTTEYEEMNEVTVEITTETGYAVKMSDDGNMVIVDMDGNTVVYEEVVGYTVDYDEAGNFVLVDREGTVYELDNYDELVTKAVQDYVDGTTGASEGTEATESTEIVITEEKESDADYEVVDYDKKTNQPAVEKDIYENKGSDFTSGGSTDTTGSGAATESGNGYSGGNYEFEDLDSTPDEVLDGGGATGDSVTIGGTEYTYDDQGTLVDSNEDPDNYTDVELESARQQDTQDDSVDWENWEDNCEGLE